MDYTIIAVVVVILLLIIWRPRSASVSGTATCAASKTATREDVNDLIRALES